MIETFVASAEKEEPTSQRSGNLSARREGFSPGLFERSPVGSQQNLAKLPLPGFHPLDGFEDRLGTQEHSGPTSERAIIHASMLSLREVAKVEQPNLDETFISSDAKDPSGEIGVDRVGKECEDVDEQCPSPWSKEKGRER